MKVKDTLFNVHFLTVSRRKTKPSYIFNVKILKLFLSASPRLCASALKIQLLSGLHEWLDIIIW